MADVKISGLPAASSVVGTQEFEVNESGTSKKVTGAQIAAYIGTQFGTIATQNANNVTISGGSITGITDLAIADGGTGGSTAQAARTNILPSQTGNGGKALVSDGTDVSFQSIGVSDGDKGDITVSSSGATWTIDSGAITTAKIADGNVTGLKLENSGVTAGSYTIASITVDAKGRVTAASSGTAGGGVTSLNGQTGAIDNTTQYSIGSYVLGQVANTTSYNNSTIAGSSLYATGTNITYQSLGESGAGWYQSNGSKLSDNSFSDSNFVRLVNTGSWRCVSIRGAQFVNLGYAQREWTGAGLWVRYA